METAVDPKTKKKLTDKEGNAVQTGMQRFFGGNCEEDNGEITREVRSGTELSFLDPREMGAAVKEENLKRCKAVRRQLNEADRVSDNDVDEIIQQYSQYIDETVVPRCSEHTNFFCVSTSRLDELLFDTMANNSSTHKL